MNSETPIPVLLPKRPRQRVESDAAALGVYPSQIIANIVTDYYDAFGLSDPEQKPNRIGPPTTDQLESNTPFQVAGAFPKYPLQSLKWSQDFVNEAVSLPGVSVRRLGRSLIFVPRFARIDYVLSNRAPMPGLVVSFYGTVDQFDDPHRLLKSGPKSYVRARITSEAELDHCRRFLARAFENRFGRKA